MDFLIDSQLRIILQLLLAAVLGGVVGFEREWKGKSAGLRTHSLVCLGATLFTIISLESFNGWLGKAGISFDPSRIVSAVVMGTGFIGAGLIIYRRFKVEGLTTAADIWVISAIGVAIGVQLYLVAVFTAFLTLGILTALKLFEEKIFKGEDVKEEEIE